MALPIPSTQVVKDRNLANLELSINQNSPLADIAFLRVLAGMEALNYTELYKYGVERAKQNLALTATGEDLELIGKEYNVFRKVAEATVLEITLPGTNGTVIPSTIDFVGNSNGIRYFADASAIITGGIATLSVTAETTGVVGNLAVTETLTIGTQIPGAETIATVVDILNTGAEEENEEIYRERVLFAERVVTGGGNVADYKIWAEEVAGVKRVYSYAGKPFDVILTSYPGDRTIYVEATTDIDPDGIAPPSLLLEVREALNIDPLTGITRPPLGIIDDTLYVESIIRTSFYVEIRYLNVDPDIEAQVKLEIETALIDYFLALRPYVAGIDLIQNRNDRVTTVSVSEIVQDVIAANGAFAEEVIFGTVIGSFIPLYTLDPNELSKLGGITYIN